MLIDIDENTDVSCLKYEDLRIVYGTYGSGYEQETTVESESEAAKPKRFTYRLGFLTPLGDIQRNIWYRLAEKLIYHNYEGWITDALQEWYLTHHPGDGTSEKAWQLALKTHIHREHESESWIYYIPWNRENRPSALEGNEYPTVSFLCCGHNCAIALVLIQNEKKVLYSRCPNCYEISELEVLSGGNAWRAA